MKNTVIYVEQLPEHFNSDLSITITCKKSELYEAYAIIDYLSSIINITFKRIDNDNWDAIFGKNKEDKKK